MSRSAMSLISVFTPCFMILTLGAVGVRPKNSSIKTLLEVNCIALALLLGLPASVAIFPPVSKKVGNQLESEFHKEDMIYFSKGL